MASSIASSKLDTGHSGATGPKLSSFRMGLPGATSSSTVGSTNPDPKIAALEDEFKSLGNSIGMGAMGFMVHDYVNFGFDEADVIVCDGFIGNVVLKTSEAVAEAIGSLLRENIGENLIRRMGYLLMRPAFRALKRKVDYAEYGGAPLLGVNGISIISHGRSSDRAIKNAIRVAMEFAKTDVNRHIHDDIVQNMELVRGK